MNWREITNADLREMTKNIDSLVIGADGMPEMYRKLNTLTANGSGNWQLLRSPTWVKGVLVAVVIKPSNDYEDEK